MFNASLFNLVWKKKKHWILYDFTNILQFTSKQSRISFAVWRHLLCMNSDKCFPWNIQQKEWNHKRNNWKWVINWFITATLSDLVSIYRCPALNGNNIKHMSSTKKCNHKIDTFPNNGTQVSYVLSMGTITGMMHIKILSSSARYWQTFQW